MPFDSFAIASDHRGYTLKIGIVQYFSNSDLNVTDYGPNDENNSVDYPDYARRVAQHVQKNKRSFGVLICLSGIGMTTAANRFIGIRAALCNCEELAKLSREHNDANIICLGTHFTNHDSAIHYITTFYNTHFTGGRHIARIKKIDSL
ncbi:MAG: ribose 5-phosphate isomerase B [Holosporales bacterium]|nr:ribose 5-phosphate isomerase B [Holosporales bacterium]